jgi:signal transduction histidine kinase
VFAKTSLILRVGVLCTALVTLALALMGGAILWLFTQSSARILDNHLMAYTDIIISRVEFRGNALSLHDDGKLLAGLPRYWQISYGGKPLYRSQILKEPIVAAPEDMTRSQRIKWMVDGKDIIALQTTFLFPHDRKVTLISGLDATVAEAYKDQEREQLAQPLYRLLLLSGLVLISMCVVLAYYALRPVRSVKAALQSIREGRAERLEGDYPAEIKALADEINRLLDYMSGSIARHREFSGNLAHSLKTPLTVIANETDIKVIKGKLRNLMDIVDRSLARVHAAGTSNVLGASAPILPVLADIGQSFGKVYAKQVDIDYPAGIAFRGDHADLYEVLGNIIENACKFSRSRVSIGHLDGAIVIEDDGPGIPESRRADVLKRGARLDETTPGTGIGLAVASDIIALYQGDIRLETSALGGLKVLIFLPTSR